MDYISKRKNNIQSISIYCRPHQGLREEKPFCELPPVLLHPCSSQQTWHHSCSKGWELGWAGPGSPTEAFPCPQPLVPAVLEQDTESTMQPLLPALPSHAGRPTRGAFQRNPLLWKVLSFSWCSLLLCQRQHRAVAALRLPRPLTNLKTDNYSLPAQGKHPRNLYYKNLCLSPDDSGTFFSFFLFFSPY